ncbi:MAG: MFS transporter [Acidobacteria bacterium]|nr:MFS transporter [Acidobacteriota bacterium]
MSGTIAGGAVSGYMGQHFGWRSSFILFGSLGVVLGFILILALKEAPRSRSVPVEPDAHSMIDLEAGALERYSGDDIGETPWFAF